MPAPIARRRFLVAGLAAAFTTVIAVLAAAEDDPRAFARSLYAHENLWSDVTADEETTKTYLDADLADLILENHGKESFESALDYDPLIQAQDWDDLRTTYTVNSETDASAVITVVVENFGERIFVTLDLTKTTDGWRLSDIRGPDGASLVEELKRLNAAS